MKNWISVVVLSAIATASTVSAAERCKTIYEAEASRLTPLAQDADAKLKTIYQEASKSGKRSIPVGAAIGAAAGATIGGLLHRENDDKDASAAWDIGVPTAFFSLVGGAIWSMERESHYTNKHRKAIDQYNDIARRSELVNDVLSVVNAAEIIVNANQDSSIKVPSETYENIYERAPSWKALVNDALAMGEDPLNSAKDLAANLARNILDLDARGSFCKKGKLRSANEIILVADGM